MSGIIISAKIVTVLISKMEFAPSPLVISTIIKDKS
jgi:hypothetical protein